MNKYYTMNKYVTMSGIITISRLLQIYNLWDLMIPLLTVPAIDIALTKTFGSKSRWFQLHSAINGIIVCIIWKDVMDLFYNPLLNVRVLDTKIDSYFVIVLHIYHLFIVKQLSLMDYFHHILFIGTGVIPSVLYYNLNLIRLAWFSSCGFPGCIEYFTLSLVKHDIMCPIKQKRYNSYIYNYIRYPITIYGPSITYIIYVNNILQERNISVKINVFMVSYFNILLFFNGAFYNKITIENYILHKYKKNNSLNNLAGYHS